MTPLPPEPTGGGQNMAVTASLLTKPSARRGVVSGTWPLGQIWPFFGHLTAGVGSRQKTPVGDSSKTETEAVVQQ